MVLPQAAGWTRGDLQRSLPALYDSVIQHTEIRVSHSKALELGLSLYLCIIYHAYDPAQPLP